MKKKADFEEESPDFQENVGGSVDHNKKQQRTSINHV